MKLLPIKPKTGSLFVPKAFLSDSLPSYSIIISHELWSPLLRNTRYRFTTYNENFFDHSCTSKFQGFSWKVYLYFGTKEVLCSNFVSSRNNSIGDVEFRIDVLQRSWKLFETFILKWYRPSVRLTLLYSSTLISRKRSICSLRVSSEGQRNRD